MMPLHGPDRWRERNSAESDENNQHIVFDAGKSASYIPLTTSDADTDLEDPLINNLSQHRRKASFPNVPWARLSNSSSGTSAQKSKLIVRLVCLFVIISLAWALLSTLFHKYSKSSSPSPLRTYFPPYNLGNATYRRHWTLSDDDLQSRNLANWRVPIGTKVVGIIFYGRRRTASLLNCYVERNLKRNGGMLDEVIWMQGTSKPDEVEWMNYVVNKTDGYRSWYNQDFAQHRLYKPAYSVIFDEQHTGPVVYVKMDDDIVFMEDIAISAIVHRLLTDEHKPLLVGANVVNQAALSWVHYSMAAIDSYLPELPMIQSAGDIFSSFFHNSGSDGDEQEPYWHGPADYQVPKDFIAPKSDKTGESNHRWLPLDPNGPMTIDSTPIAKDATFYPFGDALMWWPIGAQQHYSFLGRLRANTINALKFNVWDFNYVRMGIQFYAMKREDILERFPFPIEDDEKYLSTQATKESQRRGYVDGRNVVSHYSYGPQLGGMDTTDILPRYRAFAEQHICISLDALQYADSLLM